MLIVKLILKILGGEVIDKIFILNDFFTRKLFIQLNKVNVYCCFNATLYYVPIIYYEVINRLLLISNLLIHWLLD